MPSTLFKSSRKRAKKIHEAPLWQEKRTWSSDLGRRLGTFREAATRATPQENRCHSGGATHASNCKVALDPASRSYHLRAPLRGLFVFPIFGYKIKRWWLDIYQRSLQNYPLLGRRSADLEYLVSGKVSTALRYVLGSCYAKPQVRLRFHGFCAASRCRYHRLRAQQE